MPTIYGLQDPRDLRIRYVGCTCSLRCRALAHVQDARKGSGGAKGEWIRELLALDLLPSMVALEHVTEADSAAREQHWVAHHRALSGPRLTNRRAGEGSPPRVSTYAAPWSAERRAKHMAGIRAREARRLARGSRVVPLTIVERA